MKVVVRVKPPYPALIEPGLLDALADHVSERRVAVVSDSNVQRLYGGRVATGLAAGGRRVSSYAVEPGEASKTLATLERVARAMVVDGVDRSSAVVALGGGVVGDLAGFVAATFMRGIALYQAPTSLLAMVDASVGGKTGVNLPEGKNLVGTFWQPRAVLIDPLTLVTLPDRELRQGAVELFKHGLIADFSIVEALAGDAGAAMGDHARAAELIWRSLRVKADIVAGDERESGTRAHLNLGHTLAHALEAYSDHSLNHGDAVAYGLYFALRVSALRGFEDQSASLHPFLRWVAPAPLPTVAFEALEPYLARDKKQRGGRPRWVLLERLGKPVVAEDVTREVLELAWRDLVNLAAELTADRQRR